MRNATHAEKRGGFYSMRVIKSSRLFESCARQRKPQAMRQHAKRDERSNTLRPKKLPQYQPSTSLLTPNRADVFVTNRQRLRPRQAREISYPFQHSAERRPDCSKFEETMPSSHSAPSSSPFRVRRSSRQLHPKRPSVCRSRFEVTLASWKQK